MLLNDSLGTAEPSHSGESASWRTRQGTFLSGMKEAEDGSEQVKASAHCAYLSSQLRAQRRLRGGRKEVGRGLPVKKTCTEGLSARSQGLSRSPARMPASSQQPTLLGGPLSPQMELGAGCFTERCSFTGFPAASS